jgi:hypothetical protein
MLRKLAFPNYMIIMNTKFQHKYAKQPGYLQSTINQIDHVLVNANRKEVIQNLRSKRGPNMDLDPFLLKQKLLTEKKASLFKKWNKANLQNAMKLRQYRTLVYNGLKNIADQQEINEEWENINSNLRICKRNSSVT